MRKILLLPFLHVRRFIPQKLFYLSSNTKTPIYFIHWSVLPKSFLCLARKFKLSHSAQSLALTIMHQDLKLRHAAPGMSPNKRKACARRREISFSTSLRQSRSLLAPEISGVGYMDSSLVCDSLHIPTPTHATSYINVCSRYRNRNKLFIT